MPGSRIESPCYNDAHAAMASHCLSLYYGEFRLVLSNKQTEKNFYLDNRNPHPLVALKNFDVQWIFILYIGMHNWTCCIEHQTCKYYRNFGLLIYRCKIRQFELVKWLTIAVNKIEQFVLSLHSDNIWPIKGVCGRICRRKHSSVQIYSGLKRFLYKLWMWMMSCCCKIMKSNASSMNL